MVKINKFDMIIGIHKILRKLFIEIILRQIYFAPYLDYYGTQGFIQMCYVNKIVQLIDKILMIRLRFVNSFAE